jgi:hypothetical protein
MYPDWVCSFKSIHLRLMKYLVSQLHNYVPDNERCPGIRKIYYIDSVEKIVSPDKKLKPLYEVMSIQNEEILC